MKILLTGAAGRLGKQLLPLLARDHDVVDSDIVGDVSQRLDICDFYAARKLVAELAPDLILHPAAWTDVDGCALDPQKALRINGLATGHLAAISAAQGSSILYVSSNEVFAGNLGRAYTEADAPVPANAYGYSKWYGERAISQVNPRHYIVRSAWLFAHGGGNFVQAMLNAAQAGKALRVVTNEVANPTYTNDLAAAIVKLIESQRFGIYHLVNEGAVSRWQFARAILDQAGYAATPIERISRHQWQRPSLPPEYTPLANIAGSGIGIRLRPWQEALSAFLAAEADA